MEGLSDEIEGDCAVLDACAGSFVESNEWSASCDGEFLDLDHLFAVDLSEGAAENGAVLGEYADLSAVNGSPASDNSVGDGALVLHVEGGCAVLGQSIELDEGAFVEEIIEAFAGSHAAGCANLFVGNGAHWHRRFRSSAQKILVACRGGKWACLREQLFFRAVDRG